MCVSIRLKARPPATLVFGTALNLVSRLDDDSDGAGQVGVQPVRLLGALADEDSVAERVERIEDRASPNVLAIGHAGEIPAKVAGLSNDHLPARRELAGPCDVHQAAVEFAQGLIRPRLAPMKGRLRALVVELEKFVLLQCGQMRYGRMPRRRQVWLVRLDRRPLGPLGPGNGPVDEPGHDKAGGAEGNVWHAELPVEE